MENAGKIEAGQKAILKFQAYPFKEFGVVESRVTGISALPEADKDGNKFYELTINLEQPIVTSFQDTIPYRPDLSVNVEVITEDRTLFSENI